MIYEDNEKKLHFFCIYIKKVMSRRSDTEIYKGANAIQEYQVGTIYDGGQVVEKELRLFKATGRTSETFIQSEWVEVSEDPNAYTGASAVNTVMGGTTASSKLHVINNSDQIGLIVQGNATQTANLQEWQNSSGTAQGWVTSDIHARFLSGAIGNNDTPGWMNTKLYVLNTITDPTSNTYGGYISASI